MDPDGHLIEVGQPRRPGIDLLCAQAIGYPLRKTSAFAPLKLETEAAPAGIVGKKYSEKVRATGGIPFYNWDVPAGTVVTKGTLTMLPFCALLTFTSALPIRVSEPGNPAGKLLVV